MHSRYPYDGYYQLKNSVFERDNYTCQWCGKKLGDSISCYASMRGRYEHILSEVDFIVHHKDGDKFNNTMENLITICSSCHASHHRKGRTRKKIQADRWRRNYYAQKKLKDNKETPLTETKGQPTLISFGKRKRAHMSERRFEEAKRLHKQGLTIREIAEKMNIADTTARSYVYSDFARAHRTKVRAKISKQIEKFGLPQTWEGECYNLYEEFLKSHSPNIGKPTRLINSILLLLCRRKRFIEPKELVKATRGAKGSSARKSLHFFRVLETLNDLTPATPEDDIKRFFVDNPEYEEFLPKALNIASKLPPREFQGKNPRILASVCVYVSSVGESWGGS